MGVDVELNGKPEEAGKESVNVQVLAFEESEQEQNVVLQPDTECKGMEEVPLFVGDGEEDDVQVNITGSVCLGSAGKLVEEGASNCQGLIDNTECSSSSSFADTGSGLETAVSGSAFSDDSDGESPVCDDSSEPLLFRKKKLTDHWRRFIRPLMWRCKWIELHVKKLNSQALKYEKELAEYDYRKQLELLKFTIDDFGVKSVPVSHGMYRNRVMKRKKRKRAEECDLTSYVSNHHIFSYYENKNCHHDACLEDFHSNAIAMPMKGDVNNIEEFKLNDMLSTLPREDNDISFNDTLHKIEELQSQVQNLKTRIDNVISENPGNFCYVSQLSMIGSSDAFTHSGHGSTSLAGNENQLPDSFIHASSQQKSGLYMEDQLLTKNRLSTLEATTNRRLEVLQENIKEAVKEEVHDFENVTEGLVEEQKFITPSEVSESDLIIENNVRKVRSTLRACSSLRSRKPSHTRRGRKKYVPKSWSKR